MFIWLFVYFNILLAARSAYGRHGTASLFLALRARKKKIRLGLRPRSFEQFWGNETALNFLIYWKQVFWLWTALNFFISWKQFFFYYEQLWFFLYIETGSLTMNSFEFFYLLNTGLTITTSSNQLLTYTTSSCISSSSNQLLLQVFLLKTTVHSSNRHVTHTQKLDFII